MGGIRRESGMELQAQWMMWKTRVRKWTLGREVGIEFEDAKAVE